LAQYSARRNDPADDAGRVSIARYSVLQFADHVGDTEIIGETANRGIQMASRPCRRSGQPAGVGGEQPIARQAV
jgi:hypothetical protein